MKYDKIDTLHLVFEPYVIKILHLLRDNSKRFSNLRADIHNPRTLSLKLSKLLEYGLIEAAPMKINNKFTNSYKLTPKGKKILLMLDKI